MIDWLRGLFEKRGDATRILPVAGGEPAPMGSSAANAAVREALLAHGDDGSVPRHVVHWAYPASEGAASLAEISEYLRKGGFDVSEASDGGVQFEHSSEVASVEFDGLTLELYRVMNASGWEYDGWECAVVESERASQ